MLVIAHNIRSLHNVGSIFRSADAFGVKHLYLSGFTGFPPRKEIAKTALGSEHRVAWSKIDDIQECISDLKMRGFLIVGLDNISNACSIHDFRTSLCSYSSSGGQARPDPKKTVLILGNEIEGLSQEVTDLCDKIVSIPLFGTKQSLNVSVATGIALFAFFEKKE